MMEEDKAVLNLNDFLNLTRAQERERLLAAFNSMEDNYDRYRALIAVEALAGEGEQP